MSQEYDNGDLEFLNFAFSNAPRSDKIPCPCVRCNNCLMQNRHVMHNHFQNHGKVRNYVRWVMHGEYEFNESTYEDEFEDSPHISWWELEVLFECYWNFFRNIGLFERY